MRSARSAVQVGCPTWSSTTVRVSRSAARRSIVATKLPPPRAVEPGRADDPRLGAQGLDGPLAGGLGAAVGRAGRDGVVDGIRLAGVAVEDVVGRDLHHAGRRRACAARARLAAPTALTAKAPASSVSAASTAVHAAQLTTRSCPSTPATHSDGSVTSRSPRSIGVTTCPARAQRGDEVVGEHAARAGDEDPQRVAREGLTGPAWRRCARPRPWRSATTPRCRGTTRRSPRGPRGCRCSGGASRSRRAACSSRWRSAGRDRDGR